MSLRHAPYRDPLQALHTKQAWTVDTLSTELAHGQAAVAAHERTLNQVMARRAQVLSQLERGRDGALDLALDQRLQAYLEQLEAERTQATRALDDARAQREAVREQLVAARRLLDGYERRRERSREEHVRQGIAMAIKEADDAWLLRQSAAGDNDARA
jgi:flagellar export protein FliJ